MFRFALRMAWRFLITSRSQMLLVILGITVGVSIQIFLSSLISGLQADLIQQTVGDAPHIIIAPEDRTPSSFLLSQGNLVVPLLASPVKEESKILSWQPIQKQLLQRQDIRVSSPLVEGSGIVQKEDLKKNVILKGVFLNYADLIYKLKERTREGITQIGGNNILVGKELASDLRLNPGDTISIVMPSGKQGRFIVSGIFDLENKATNSSWIFMDLPTAQTLLDKEGAISIIEIQIDQVFQSENIAQKLKQEFTQYNIETWQTRNQQLLSALRSQSLSSYMIQFFVLLAVTLGIASVLVVSVTQKIREIGILKAIGTTNTGVSLIFLMQGAILGVFGSSLGVLSGFLLIRLFQQVAQASGGAISFSIDVNLFSLLLILTISIIASILAAISPARQATKLVPIEVIRNG
ncbi:MAG: lipoprotein-releasing system permease protein [Candidatus Atribacteria bacterium]|nr:lipoprotein-releasing system permease protein [Candidatus Atribacteria bacterium]